jgi:transcriptional regulator with XRE-family HTH domain
VAKENTLKNLGGAIKAARQEKGITQSQLVERLDIGQQ